MRYLAIAALALTGCAQLGLSTTKLDAAATAQNADNVAALVGENDAYLAADPKAESLKQAQRDRNAAALALAKKMAEAAK